MNTGIITGTATDPSGAAVPNVKVIGRRVEKKKGEEETLVGEVLTLSKNEDKKSDGNTGCSPCSRGRIA